MNEDIAEFKEGTSASGQDPDARAFASATLPTWNHLKTSQEIAATAGRQRRGSNHLITRFFVGWPWGRANSATPRWINALCPRIVIGLILYLRFLCARTACAVMEIVRSGTPFINAPGNLTPSWMISEAAKNQKLCA